MNQYNMNNFICDFEVENNNNDTSYYIDTVIDNFKSYIDKSSNKKSPNDVEINTLFILNNIPRSIKIYPKDFRLSQIESKRVNNRYSSINIKSKFKHGDYIDILI